MRSFLLQALLLAVVAMMGGANAAQCPSSDIIWVLDSSSSVLANPSATAELTDFLAKFTSKVDPTSTRQGFVEYAGPYFRLPGSDTILSSFALSHNQTGFISALDGLSPVGGTTNTASALDFVHATFLAENRTVASRHTIVVLASDGSPTDVYGDDTAEAEQLASLAAQRLTQLPNVELAFLRLGEFHYRPNFLLQEANYVYLSQYERLSALLKDEFLCVAPPPKCRYPSPMEIIWVLDGSSSMVESSGSFSNVTNFIADFTERLDPQAVVRQGFLEYGGAYADDPQFGTVIDALNTTSDMNLFLSRLEALTAVGGTTNTADAIDYVLNVMLAGQAPNPNRFVILATDGNPSDMFGETTNDTVAAAEQAAARIRQVAGATFVFLRFGQHNYYPGFLEGTADHIYDADYVRLRRLFAQNFLCATDSPSTSPTTQPTLVPTNQPTLAPTGQPTVSPTGQPTKQPTLPPTGQPTLPPTGQPTLTPTSQPTVAPIDQPTLVPTTRGPTKKPSTPAPVKSSTILQPSLSSVPTAPPTLAPIETASPVYSPSMAPIVTQSPIATLAPVFAPSQVPTVCVPGVVSCCISMFVNLVAMYVNEVDITSSIQGDLNNQTTNKFVQFPEPSHDAVIGFKGYEARETYVGTLAIRCSCTRPESNWNFASENVTGVWNAMPSLTQRTDGLSPGWYFNNRTAGLKQRVLTSNQQFATLTDARCGNPDAAVRLQAVQGNNIFYWAFRRIVNGTGCVGTRSPTTLGNSNTVDGDFSQASSSDGETDDANTTSIIVGSIVGALAVVGLVAAAVVIRSRASASASGAAAAGPPTTIGGKWDEHADEEGLRFWINKNTGEFSWSVPEGTLGQPRA